MTDTLREALRDRADRAQAYDVYDRAMRTARRRRQRRIAAAAAAIALLAAGAVSLPRSVLAERVVTPADHGPSLPDRVGPPHGAPSVSSDPAGPAALVFSDVDGLVFVGAFDDTYRTWAVQGQAYPDAKLGESVLLSPDGTRLAHPSKQGECRVALCGSGPPPSPIADSTAHPMVLDLRTGRSWAASAPVEEDPPFSLAQYVPLAWSPDGHTLAVATLVNGRGELKYKAIGLLDTDAASYRRLAAVDVLYGGLGRAAFSPDGRRLAVQGGPGSGPLRVFDLDSGAVDQFDLPFPENLAGKGAWTPDGSALVTVSGDSGLPDGDARLTLRDPRTGSNRTGPDWRLPADAINVRILGWTRVGEPVVAVDVRVTSDDTRYDQTVRVLAVRVGAVPRTVLDVPAEVLDVASDVIATSRIRPGHPPVDWMRVAFIGVLATALAGLTLLVTRRRRRRRRVT
jgi:hypothetical protein